LENPKKAISILNKLFEREHPGVSHYLIHAADKLAEKNKAPENPTVHYHLGLAYEKTEQPALARQHLERVLKINPNYSSAADVKKILSQLRS